MTLMTPLMCYQGVHYLYGVRVIEGVLGGLSFPSINTVYAKWSPPMGTTDLIIIDGKDLNFYLVSREKSHQRIRGVWLLCRDRFACSFIFLF